MQDGELCFPWWSRDLRRVPAQAHLRHRRRRIHRIHWIQQIHEVRREQRETACRIFRSGWRTSQKNLEDAELPAPAKHFSWLGFGTSHKHGTKEAQYLHSLPERPKLRSLQANQDYKCSLKKADWWISTRAEFRWLDNSRSQSLQRSMWFSKQSSIFSRCTRFSHSMDSVVPVQNKNYPGDGKEFTKVSRADWKAESHLHRQHIGLWQILWRLFMESSYFDTPGIAERAVRRIKEGTSEYYCNQAWMKSGGLILCNAIAICEMFKTYRHMGKHLTNDDSENHWKARSFRAVQLWLSIIRLLQKTSQGPTTLVRHF